MKGMINKQGVLHIQRAGYMQAQDCPYSSVPNDKYRKCGDWCPLFSEPIYLGKDRIGGIPVPSFDITICQDRTIRFNGFYDGRVKQVNEVSK